MPNLIILVNPGAKPGYFGQTWVHGVPGEPSMYHGYPQYYAGTVLPVTSTHASFAYELVRIIVLGDWGLSRRISPCVVFG